ncbi:hypothetical protein STANM309S_06183 [Streptomyces tanashiensis]
MIDADAVEAVIGLAHGLFYNSGMEAIVLVLRKQKPADRKHKVLFIDAKKEFYRAGVQSFLSETHQQCILNAFQNFADVPGFARVATLDEIRANNGNLAIPQYVTPATPGRGSTPTDSVAAALAGWREAAAAADVAVDDIYGLLRAEVVR